MELGEACHLRHGLRSSSVAGRVLPTFRAGGAGTNKKFYILSGKEGTLDLGYLRRSEGLGEGTMGLVVLA
jgi:hypothetical protein